MTASFVMMWLLFFSKLLFTVLPSPIGIYGGNDGITWLTLLR